MALLLLALLIVVPLAELYVLWQVGSAIGILPTIGLLLLASLVGAALLRSQGRTAWRRFNEATAAGRIPAREVADGVMIIFGGAFLLTPGFLTDMVGVLLLLPPTRALLRRTVVGLLARRSPIGYVGVKAAPHAQRAWQQRQQRRNGVPGDVVEGTATEHDDEPGESRRLDP